MAKVNPVITLQIRKSTLKLVFPFNSMSNSVGLIRIKYCRRMARDTSSGYHKLSQNWSIGWGISDAPNAKTIWSGPVEI